MKKMLVLSLGSNLGNRYANIKQSLELLSEKFNAQLEEANYYETPPWGETNQSKFINTAAYLETDLDVHTCFDIAQSVEQEMGRRKTKKWGPRKIDIDILFYGDDSTKSEQLEIPHPRLHERAFVLVPLLDIIPNKVHPDTGVSLSKYLIDLKNDCEPFS